MKEIEQLEFKDLIGLKIKNVQIDGDSEILKLYTDQGQYYISCWGDCCARCYIYHVSFSDALKDAKIINIYKSEWINVPESDRDRDVVIETLGIKIQTDKGYCDIETRLKHNGYYGGNFTITKDIPLGQYGHEIQKWILNQLRDF